MSNVVALETQANLPELMGRVANGESITITREGVPVARLVPATLEEKPEVEAAVRALLEFRKSHPIDSKSFWELIEEGRAH